MATGFDIIGSNKALQEHWIRRIAAYIIDIIIVTGALWVVLWLLGIRGWLEYGLISGFIFLAYCVALEANSGRTFGKAILGLELIAEKGYIDFHMAFIRNIPKFFWYIFPLLDTVLGLATEGDPRQRFTDRIVGTTVVSTYTTDYKANKRPSNVKAAGNPMSQEPSKEKCFHCGAPLAEIGKGKLQCSGCGIIQ